MELPTGRIVQVSSTPNREHDRISKTLYCYVPRQLTKYIEREALTEIRHL
jgi:hypothetical protein